MDAYRTEDEQVEALKRWWKENGTSTILGIVLVVGGYFGWQAWQTRQLQNAEAASANYQQLLRVSAEIEQQASDERYATARHLVDTLKTDFDDSEYARYAALMQASLLVKKQDLAGAETELRWVLDSNPEPELQQVARLRLARVLFAAGDAEQALSIINAADYGEYSAAYYELRGDIHYKQGDVEAARKDYQGALENSEGGAQNAPLVRMKLESLPQDAAVQDSEAQGD